MFCLAGLAGVCARFAFPNAGAQTHQGYLAFVTYLLLCIPELGLGYFLHSGAWTRYTYDGNKITGYMPINKVGSGLQYGAAVTAPGAFEHAEFSFLNLVF